MVPISSSPKRYIMHGKTACRPPIWWFCVALKQLLWSFTLNHFQVFSGFDMFSLTANVPATFVHGIKCRLTVLGTRLHGEAPIILRSLVIQPPNQLNQSRNRSRSVQNRYRTKFILVCRRYLNILLSSSDPYADSDCFLNVR